MAGSAMGDGDEAVQLNVTPLIDIIFCLCIFFICSFHFKELSGKLDSWLPKDKGNQSRGPTTATMDEIRIFVRKSSSGPTELAYGARTVGVLTGDTASDWAVYDQLENLEEGNIELQAHAPGMWTEFKQIRVKRI